MSNGIYLVIGAYKESEFRKIAEQRRKTFHVACISDWWHGPSIKKPHSLETNK